MAEGVSGSMCHLGFVAEADTAGDVVVGAERGGGAGGFDGTDESFAEDLGGSRVTKLA